MSFAFHQMLHNVTRHDRGWETKNKRRGCGTRYDRFILRQHVLSRRAGATVLGEEWQCLPAYQGSQHRRRTRHQVYAKRANLVPQCPERCGRYTKVSRDGREIASATPFSAVGIQSNDNMNPCSTCSANSCTSNA